MILLGFIPILTEGRNFIQRIAKGYYRPVVYSLCVTPWILLVDWFGTPTGGRGSLVVKVTGTWPSCHEFEPSASENPPCRVVMHVKSVEAQAFTRWCGMEVSCGVPT
ncbi:hypothetical protein TNCV_2533121 [Trichonephila clavipes]|nr:hypothetical protein TNCV_2533121 [Trichonephila clavipes]